MLHTLIVITMFSAPSPMLAQHTYESAATCERILKRTSEGLVAASNASLTGPHRVRAEDVTVAGGWTLLRTPLGRVIAQLRCEPHAEPAAAR